MSNEVFRSRITGTRRVLSPTARAGNSRNASLLVEAHLPCGRCGSSDALARYDDGHTYCFSCGAYEDTPKKGVDESQDAWYNIKTVPEGDTIASYLDKNNNNKERSVPVFKSYTEIDGPGWRGIEPETMKFFGVKCRISDGAPHSFVFPWGGSKKQIREVREKRFYMEGTNEGSDPLFGMSKFPMGSASAITITEGVLDCLSAFQMLGSKYPCVSVLSSSTAKSDAQKAFKYLDSFEKIYLAFDNDEPGIKALKQVASLFDPNKIYVVPISDPYKDANDFIKNGNHSKEFHKVWWSSRKHRPKGIIESFSDIKEVLEAQDARPVATYPFPTLQEMTYGIRLGEVNLITAQEKVGKTAFLSALEHHLIKTTDYGLGIIHLEQAQKRSIQGILNYELDRATNLPDSGVSNEDMLKAYEKLVRKEGRVHFYSHFGSDDPDVILDIIRYLVAVCGCKFIFLDHITMLVTGMEGDDERRQLDYLSTRLAMLTRELNFTLFLVSHVNDDGKTRGSRNISKVADLILYLTRDTENASFDIRNTTTILIKGNRDVAASGPAGYLFFDNRTYTLHEKTVEDVLVDNEGAF